MQQRLQLSIMPKKLAKALKLTAILQTYYSARYLPAQSQQTKTNRGKGVLACVYVRFFKKILLRFSKWSYIVILQFFLLIIMAVWIIKQIIMKDYNIQSCQWMMCDRFRQPLLLCTSSCSFLCTVHFLCAFSAKMTTYLMCTSWSVVRKRTRAKKGGGGQNSESWANVLFECPLMFLLMTLKK